MVSFCDVIEEMHEVKSGSHQHGGAVRCDGCAECAKSFVQVQKPNTINPDVPRKNRFAPIELAMNGSEHVRQRRMRDVGRRRCEENAIYFVRNGERTWARESSRVCDLDPWSCQQMRLEPRQ